MLIMREVVSAKDRGLEELHFPLDFTVSFKLFEKIKFINEK